MSMKIDDICLRMIERLDNLKELDLQDFFNEKCARELRINLAQAEDLINEVSMSIGLMLCAMEIKGVVR